MRKSIRIKPKNCMSCLYGERTNEDNVKCTHPNPKTKQTLKGWYCYSYEQGSL